MNELVKIQRDDVFTNSWVIAENIERQHRAVTTMIRRFEKDLKDLGPLFTYTGSATKTRGQERVIYDLNEQQAIFLMSLMDNSPVVVDFKKRLAVSFVAMRKLLLQKQTADWQQTRLHGKQIRLQETDAIKALIEYATAQGSANAGKLYLVYTKLVKRLTGYESRDTVDVETLTEILTFERLLFGIITQEMAQDTPYKAIYQKAKQQLLEIKRLWAMPRLTA